MATEILVKNGTPIVWADVTDYNPANSGYVQTEQITLAALADGAAREGAKADLLEKRAARFSVRVGIEFDVAPVAGVPVDFYWSASHSAVAGTGNDAGASGTDANYKIGDEAEWLAQCIYLGSLRATADVAPVYQIMTVGEFSPPERYGQVIVHNRGGQALEGDDIEMFVALIPLIDEAQTP